MATVYLSVPNKNRQWWQNYTITMFEYSNSYPAFKFSRLPCADLMVVGLIRRSLSAEEAEEVASWQPKIMSQFMLNILLPAISDLPLNTRTRRFNLVHTIVETSILPDHFRLYPEDPSQLSDNNYQIAWWSIHSGRVGILNWNTPVNHRTVKKFRKRHHQRELTVDCCRPKFLYEIRDRRTEVAHARDPL